jgi:hypothetical protein
MGTSFFGYYMPTLSMPTQSCVKPEFSYFTEEEIAEVRKAGNDELADMLVEANAKMKKCDEIP